MDSKQTHCVGGKHISRATDEIIKDKRNPKTDKIVRVKRGKCDVCGRAKSQVFTK